MELRHLLHTAGRLRCLGFPLPAVLHPPCLYRNQSLAKAGTMIEKDRSAQRTAHLPPAAITVVPLRQLLLRVPRARCSVLDLKSGRTQMARGGLHSRTHRTLRWVRPSPLRMRKAKLEALALPPSTAREIWISDAQWCVSINRHGMIIITSISAVIWSAEIGVSTFLTSVLLSLFFKLHPFQITRAKEGWWDQWYEHEQQWRCRIMGKKLQ